MSKKYVAGNRSIMSLLFNVWHGSDAAFMAGRTVFSYTQARWSLNAYHDSEQLNKIERVLTTMKLVVYILT
jgi:hypothetical protein